MQDKDDSVKVVVDDTGEVTTRMEYLPYGETWFQEGDEANKPKYNSQELDDEINFYYYNARHYDPEIARFVTADTAIDGENDTRGWNRYSYVKNNPIMYKDPTGHFSFSELLSTGKEFTGRIVDNVKNQAVEAYEGAKEGMKFAGKMITDGKFRNTVKKTINKKVDSEVHDIVTKGYKKYANEKFKKLSKHAKGIFEHQKQQFEHGNAVTATADLLTVPLELLAINRIKKVKYFKHLNKIAKPKKVKVPDESICFIAGTLILTSNGLKPIEDIAIGDEVLSRNEITGEVKNKKVVRLFKTQDQEVLELKLSTNDRVEEKTGVTGEHPFWLRYKGWTEAKNLLPGDEVFTSSGGWAKVSGNTWLSKRQTVYNFEVEEFHTYFITESEVWVHNKCNTPTPNYSFKPGGGGKLQPYDLKTGKYISSEELKIRTISQHKVSLIDKIKYSRYSDKYPYIIDLVDDVFGEGPTKTKVGTILNAAIKIFKGGG